MLRFFRRLLRSASSALATVAAFAGVSSCAGGGGDPGGPPRDAARMARTVDEIRERFDGVRHFDTDTLRARLGGEAPPVLVDVRAADEFAVSHLPGAVRVDMGLDDGELLAALPKDRDVVFYCSVGYRSALVAERARAAGFTRGANYVGSLFDWANRGLPLVDAAGNYVSTVHPYDDDWGRLLEPELRAVPR